MDLIYRNVLKFCLISRIKAIVHRNGEMQLFYVPLENLARTWRPHHCRGEGHTGSSVDWHNGRGLLQIYCDREPPFLQSRPTFISRKTFTYYIYYKLKKLRPACL